MPSATERTSMSRRLEPEKKFSPCPALMSAETITTRASAAKIGPADEPTSARRSPRSAPAREPVCVGALTDPPVVPARSEEHTSELQSRQYLGCRLLSEKKNSQTTT